MEVLRRIHPKNATQLVSCRTAVPWRAPGVSLYLHENEFSFLISWSLHSLLFYFLYKKHRTKLMRDGHSSLAYFFLKQTCCAAQGAHLTDNVQNRSRRHILGYHPTGKASVYPRRYLNSRLELQEKRWKMHFLFICLCAQGYN